MALFDDMGVSKLSAKVYLKVNYSFNVIIMIYQSIIFCWKWASIMWSIRLRRSGTRVNNLICSGDHYQNELA